MGNLMGQLYGTQPQGAGTMGSQQPSQGTPGSSILNPYNFNPYQQNQMGGMGYGMMNQIMQRLQNPQTMQNPMASPLFTTGQGYQGMQMPQNFNYGLNMAPISGLPSIYSFAPAEPIGKTKKPSAGNSPLTEEQRIKMRSERGGK